MSTLEPSRLFELRNQLWRLMARSDVPEVDLMQRLLALLGPELGLSRACYCRRVAADRYVCSAEWKTEGVESLLGTELAHVGIALQEAKDLDSEQVNEKLLSCGVSPGFQLLFGGAPTVVVLPVLLGGQLDGAVTLSAGLGESSSGGWDERTQAEVAELVQLTAMALERRRTADALRACEERYRSLVENLGEGVGIMDPNEVFLFANPAGHDIFGVPAGTLAGRNLREFTDERAFQKAREQTGLRKQMKRSTYELEIRRPDGTTRVIVVTAVPATDSKGGLAATIGNFRDVTQQRRSEELRQEMEARVHQSQKLESLGLLAGGIAHDFNNLLLGVMANAEMALEEAPAVGLQRDCLQDILSASRKAAELTAQMLAYSGRGRVQIQPLDLSTVVQDMALLLRASISKRALMAFDLAKGLPPIQGDVSQIRQVVMNLITNASDALGESAGRITMSTGVMQVDASVLADPLLTGSPLLGEHVFFEVADAGCGMDEATRARIFDPFFTTRFTGRGLGLAAVLGIVRAHQGGIRVCSERGKGTVFRVMFPAGAPGGGAVQPAGPPARREWTGSGTVLVIDDEDVVRRATTRILERAGFQVLAAADGPAGLLLFEEHKQRICAVVLDLAMPEMSGEQVFQLLHSARPELPVILISGYDQEDAAVRVASAGLAGFVRKPFDSEGLLAPLRKALGN
jgi:PAS domain S-box-containing protein